MPGSVFCQSQGPCLRRQGFIGEKMAIFVEAKVAGPHSWCQLIICPLNLIRFLGAKRWPWRTELTRALKHPYTHTHTGQNTIWDISAQVLTNTHISRCRLFLSVTVKNQTLHPSAHVIPSNKCHVAMVQTYPHEHVNQVPVTSCSMFFYILATSLEWSDYVNLLSDLASEILQHLVVRIQITGFGFLSSTASFLKLYILLVLQKFYSQFIYLFTLKKKMSDSS